MEAQPFVAQKILDEIRALSQEILHILPPKSTLIKNNVTNIGWKPPPPSFFKLNTDGSARGNPGMASVGGLLRDHRGAWVGSFSRAICFTNSMAAELWGLRDGLVLAKNLNIRKLLIEMMPKLLLMFLSFIVPIWTQLVLTVGSLLIAGYSSNISRKLVLITSTAKEIIVWTFWLKRESIIQTLLFYILSPFLIFCTSFWLMLGV